MDWRESYERKKTDMAGLLSHIHDGDGVVIQNGDAASYEVLDALYDYRDNFRNVTVYTVLMSKPLRISRPECNGKVDQVSCFLSAGERDAIAEGSHIGVQLVQLHRLLESRRKNFKINCAIVHVSPPDENGYVSLGTNATGIPETKQTYERILAHVNKNVPYNAVVQHVSGYGTDNGLTYTVAGMVLSVLMFTMMVGKVLIGTIIDRYGLIRTVAGASAICLVGLAILIAGSTFPVLSIGAGILGLSAALVTVIPAMATRQIFGSENYTQTYSFITIASILGANGSVPLLGFLYDCTRSYRIGFVVVACLITVSAVMYLVILQPARRRGLGSTGAKP